MTQRPFLSVVMPVHGGASLIGPTLESLERQQLDGVEIILIDSSPTSATADVVNGFADRLPLRSLERVDLTPWQAKTNLGVQLAAADHVCILHQDDLWLPDRAVKIRAWLEDRPEVTLHLAPSLYIDDAGRKVGRWTCPLPSEQELEPSMLLERLLVQNFVSVPAPVFKRDAWLACGGMDEGLWYTPDWDIWAKLAATGRTVYHAKATTAFRIHAGSQTVAGARDIDGFRQQMQVVLDRHLDRLPGSARKRIRRAAQVSIEINVGLAAATAGQLRPLAAAGLKFMRLGPVGMRRYLRDSRLHERLIPRVAAKLRGAF